MNWQEYGMINLLATDMLNWSNFIQELDGINQFFIWKIDQKKIKILIIKKNK